MVTVLEVVGSLVVEDPLSKKRGRALIPLDLLDGLGSFSFTASSGTVSSSLQLGRLWPCPFCAP